MVSKFPLSSPVGKSTAGKPFLPPNNSLPGRDRNDSMRNKAGIGQNTTTASYAGKSAATSSGFASSRGREFGAFIGSVPVSKLRHTRQPDTKNKI